MPITRFTACVAAVCLSMMLAVSVWAAEEKPAEKSAVNSVDKSAQTSTESSSQAPNVKTETVLHGLVHPCGVAIRPETEYVYIADRGAGQILRFAPANPGKSRPAVSGFATSAADSATSSASSSLQAIAFLTNNALAVVSTGSKSGKPEAALCVLDLPTVGSADEDKPLDYNAAGRKTTPILPQPVPKLSADAQFHLALFDFSTTMLLIDARLDKNNSMVFQAEVKHHDSIDTVRPLVRAQCIAVNQHGLLAAIVPAADSKHGCLLTFYQAQNGTSLWSTPLELHNVVAITYNEERNRLYALCDSAGSAADDDGLYRIDEVKTDGKQAAKAVKIALLNHPAAFAFGPRGTLYVATSDPSVDKSKENGSGKSGGALIKITGDL
jgi:hypothetical protein